jgi:outer membrane protein OmpA-like peptidoglycan-associated protein
LRDPEAISIKEWFSEKKIAIKNIDITEHSIKSLDLDILKARAKRLLSGYPAITAQWQEKVLTLSGSLEINKIEELLSVLNLNGFTHELNLNTDELQPIPIVDISNSTEVKTQLFKQLVGRISAIQLDFPLANSEVTVPMEKTLQNLHQYVEQLNQLADQLEINFGLLVMGCSDNSGNKQTNEKLSLERAENASKALNRLGVDRELMFVTGLGQIELNDVKSTSRKVMFNVIYVDNKSPAE